MDVNPNISFFSQVVSLDEDTSEFTAKSTFDHPYPTTKIMWIPDSKGIYPGMETLSYIGASK